MRRPLIARPFCATSAFTLVEAMISMAVVAVLLSAAMNAAGAVGLQRSKSVYRATAAGLADGLIADVLKLAYQDAGAGPLFGPETGELAADKASFDDVDDFHGWTESPPRDADNTPLTDMAGWSRTVRVERVQPAAPATISPSETGVKRITVTVNRGARAIATRVALRTAAP